MAINTLLVNNELFMNTFEEKMINRVDELIDLGNKVISTRAEYRHVPGESVNKGLFTEFRTSSLSFLKAIFEESSPYFIDFSTLVRGPYPTDVEEGLGILQGAKNEIAGGWLISTRHLISADIFSDFLEMAEYLLSEGYKDASAVIIGSVLEEHLRQLCTKHGITTTVTRSGKAIPKKADMLNSELAKANVYNKLDQKNVTTQLDLRNKAAHGKYSDYSLSQVELMLKSVLDFTTRIHL